jgi:hypothetical protein
MFKINILRQKTIYLLSLLIIRLEVVMVTKPWYVKKSANPFRTSKKPSSFRPFPSFRSHDLLSSPRRTPDCQLRSEEKLIGIHQD